MSTRTSRLAGPSRLAWVTTIPMAAAAGALTTVSVPAALAAAAIVASLLLLAAGRGAMTLFATALSALLIGYAFMGRGFAYLGVPPLYVGEFVLLLGGFALVTAIPTRRPGVAHLLIVLFMAWGALRAVPFLGTYGIETLRDSVVWGYAAFGLLLSLLLTPIHVRRAVRLYGRVLPIFIAWVPILSFLWFAHQDVLPRIPGVGIPIPFLKTGDVAVHLAGAAAFLLAGLYPRDVWRRVSEPFLWVGWIVGVAIVASVNRGGMLAVATVASVMLFTRSLGRWLSLGFVALLLVGVVGLANVEIDTGDARAISIQQIEVNIQSVLSDIDTPSLSGSKEWRQAWWDTIVAYTVHGPYFWEGKGYGINLADEDGFQVGDGTLRAPHNAHLNFLARGGVPGLVLWLAVQATFAVTMIRAANSAARSRQRLWLGVVGWVFVYWSATIVNMTFDVYLEGPQGGILFWSVIGFGLAVASCIREAEDDIRVDSSSTRGREASVPI
jgi:O-antigen ligase